MTQVVADRELMLSHLGQHRSNGVAKRMPADAGDADSHKGRLDFMFQYSPQVQRLFAFAAMRREDEISRLVVGGLRSPFQQSIFESRMHRQYFCRSLRFGRF